MITVVDTSAVLRIYIPDGPVPEGMISALREAERGNEALIAPELVLLESAQVLLKKTRQKLLTRQEMDELLGCIISLPIRLFGHKPFLVRAVSLAREHKLTVYDAIFLALAEEKSARLITADRDLKRAAVQTGLV